MEGFRVAAVLLGVCIVLGCLTAQGDSSISCYQCNSEYDPRCGDPFDAYSLGTVNCSVRDAPEHIAQKEAIMCRKNVIKVYGKTRVVRGCGYVENDPPRDETVCMRRTGTHDVQIHYCVCTGDYCNAGAATELSRTLLLATAVVALVSAVFAL